MKILCFFMIIFISIFSDNFKVGNVSKIRNPPRVYGIPSFIWCLMS